ncbi:hypothetical protein [Blastococcus tunisiensis]|uniref:Uncharacterized protein n=1 Tax=Blastococcus tunisiensis TaxID=1798228 RepID=A0A1I1XRX5_9ACTN|nr:hypothetical protein [Blastococcus sp. DSM 46838]SFE10092.1 hypothetical protein SAMN05216574_102155 [Blastococcus sp. DSM 46838]
MLTVVLAWLAALAVCVAAVLFGQSTRAAPRRRSAVGRVGLFLSLSGPWLSVLAAAAAAALTDGWLVAAAAGACGVVLTCAAGFLLSPR